jgi:hypothetical protein
MRVHMYACYWIGASIGFLVGLIVGFGLTMMDSCSTNLPAVTMGDRAQ